MEESSVRLRKRCPWAEAGNELYLCYHDSEWGLPVHDDTKQFEFLVLEGAQAGLSWATVLNKREGYRKAFANFDPVRVARFSEATIQSLLSNSDIIRNQLKIRSAVSNARAFLKLQEEFGCFDDYIWRFVDGRTIQNRWRQPSEVPVTSSQSDALSRDLKQRGFRFTGSTIMYAHMQAAGLVNDHLVSCFRYPECRRLSG